jgi:hypothetical protein
MKRSFGRVLVFAALATFLVEGCGSEAPKDTRADDDATIRAYSATASEAARTKDVDKVASFYADDALAFSNYSATTTTKEAMRVDLRKSFSDPGRSVGKPRPSKWRVRAIWPTNTAATRTRPRKKTGRAKHKRETTCWCGESRPAAIGRSRSIRTPRIRRSRHLRRFRHLRNNPRG